MKDLVIDVGRWRVRFGRNGWRDLGEYEGWDRWHYLFGGRIALHRGQDRRWDVWWL